MTFGIAWAQSSATAPATGLAPAAPATSSGGSAALGFLVILGLLVIVGIAVKLYDRKRKRDAEAVHLQAQVSDALMRDARLAGLVLTPTANVPTWGRGPAIIELSGEVPDGAMRDTVLRVAREGARGVVCVLTQILALRGPAIGIRRRESRLVGCQDECEPLVERFFEIAQVADDLDRRPGVGRGSAREDGRRRGRQTRRQLRGACRQPRQSVRARTPAPRGEAITNLHGHYYMVIYGDAAFASALHR